MKNILRIVSWFVVFSSITSCISSDKLNSEEIALTASITVVDDEARLLTRLSYVLEGRLRTRVNLQEEDRLYIQKNGQSVMDLSQTQSPEDNYQFGVSYTQGLSDNIALIFDKKSTGEFLKTTIDIPFYLHSLSINEISTNLEDNASLTITWNVNSSDLITLPSNNTLRSVVKECVDLSGTQIYKSNFKNEGNIVTFIESDGLANQEISVPVSDVAYVSQNTIEETIEYCDYEVQLGTNWFTSWDGKEPPNGVIDAGPAWITPDTGFGNANITRNNEVPIFSISVLSGVAVVRVNY